MKFLPRILIIITLSFLGCRGSSKLNHVERNTFLMDTVVRFSLYDHRPKADLEKLIDQVFSYMQLIEKKVSAHIENSDPDRLIKAAGKGYIQINPETEAIIREALLVGKATDGAFDITVGSLKTLWGFENGLYHVPDSTELQAYLAFGTYQDIQVDSGKARINKSGLGLDLGGIAKGYIIDAAVNWLQDKGVRSGLVEGGGDLRVFGPHPERELWRIGIQHPRSERGILVGVVSVKDQSIATSGDYERYFFQDGVRYHHILDPKTGFPSRQAISVTIIAPTTMVADAYATAVFVLGPKAGIDILNQIPGIEGLCISEDENGMIFTLSDKANEWIELYEDDL